jgi:hypothetical protein
MKTIILLVIIAIPFLSFSQVDSINCRNRSLVLHILDGGNIALTLDGDTILNEPYNHDEATFEKWVNRFYTNGTPRYIISMPKMKVRGKNKGKPYVYGVMIQTTNGDLNEFYKIE